MKNNKTEYQILALAVIFTLVSCDTTSGLHEKSTYTKKAIIRSVIVPYASRYGPDYVDNMVNGTLEQAPDKSSYNRTDSIGYSAFGCDGSWANPDKDPKYYYYTRYLYFPKSVVNSAHNRYKFVITKALSPEAPKGKLMGMTRCIVPYTKNIENFLEFALKFYAKHNSPNVTVSFKTRSWELNTN